MLEPPHYLTCIEYRKRMEGNSYTRPLYVAAKDEFGEEFDIIMKVRHPDVPVSRGHYEGTSLACELICSVLGRAAGLAVPDYAIVELRSGLENSVGSSEIRSLLRNNVGLNFGTVYLEGSSTWVPRTLNRESPLGGILEDVLVFDATVINGDRKLDKPNLLWDGRTLLPIDHSTAIPAHLWGEKDIAESPLFPENEIRSHCAFLSLNGQDRAFTNLLNQLRKNIASDDIKQLRNVIPRSWERRSGDLDRIFRFLEGRERRFDNTSEHLRRIMK